MKRKKPGSTVSKSCLQTPPNGPGNSVCGDGGVAEVKHTYGPVLAFLNLTEALKKETQSLRMLQSHIDGRRSFRNLRIGMSKLFLGLRIHKTHQRQTLALDPGSYRCRLRKKKGLGCQRPKKQQKEPQISQFSTVGGRRSQHGSTGMN
jgi:hypothetical protein